MYTVKILKNVSNKNIFIQMSDSFFFLSVSITLKIDKLYV